LPLLASTDGGADLTRALRTRSAPRPKLVHDASGAWSCSGGGAERSRLPRTLVALALLLCPGCSTSHERPDDGGSSDAGREPDVDGGSSDAGLERDATTLGPDAGPPEDPCGGGIRLSPDGVQSAWLADLVADERGGLVATFETFDGVRAEARIVTYQPRAGWGASSSLDFGSAERAAHVIADVGGGRLALAWVEHTIDRDPLASDDFARNVFATSRAGGSGFDPPTALDGPEQAAEHDVAVDATGRVTVAWEQPGLASVVARRFDPTSGWGAHTVLAAGSGARFPRLVASGDETTAVWIEDAGSEARAVWARTWARGSWGAPVRLDDGTDVGPDHAQSLEVAGDGAGVVLVAWGGDAVFVAERDPVLGWRAQRVGAREPDETGPRTLRVALGASVGSADVAWAADIADRATAIHVAHAERGATTVWEPPVFLGTTERSLAVVHAIDGSVVWAQRRLVVAHRERGSWTATTIGDDLVDGARIARDGSGETWILFSALTDEGSVLCATRS
jgi:hypothetical protein